MSARPDREALSVLLRLRGDRMRRAEALQAAARAVARRAEAEERAAGAAVDAMRRAREVVHDRLHSDIAAAPSRGGARFDILRVALDASNGDVDQAERHLEAARAAVARTASEAASVRRHLAACVRAHAMAEDLLAAERRRDRRKARARAEAHAGDALDARAGRDAPQ